MSETVEYNDLPYPAPARVNQGDTYRMQYEFDTKLDQSGVIVIADLDLTDATLTLTLSSKRGGEAITLSESEIVEDDLTAGQFTVLIAAADTAELAKGKYWYQVVCEFPANHSLYPDDTKTLLQGNFTIKEDAIEDAEA